MTLQPLSHVAIRIRKAQLFSIQMNSVYVFGIQIPIVAILIY